MTQSQHSQTNTNPYGPPFSLAIAALNERFLALLGYRVPAGGGITEPLSPIWIKSVNGLIYYKHYSLYFPAYRGTISLKWPSVFLFMYLFIWEETVGTLGHYQLILLRGAFLWAEEIVCFDLLCKSVPRITAAGDCNRSRPWSLFIVVLKNVQSHAQTHATLKLFSWKSNDWPPLKYKWSRQFFLNLSPWDWVIDPSDSNHIF